VKFRAPGCFVRSGRTETPSHCLRMPQYFSIFSPVIKAASCEVTDDDVYDLVTCVACTKIHLINPKTGKVLGDEED